MCVCVCVLCCSLRVHSEGCEFHALPRFFNDSMSIWGHIPVTQLQIEVHVSPRAAVFEQSRLLVHDYGKHGLRQENAASLGMITPWRQRRARKQTMHVANTMEWNNPQSVKEDRRARVLLDSLLQHGFLPFHIHLGSMDNHSNLCCGTEE